MSFFLYTPAFAYTSLTITPISLGRHSVPEASGIIASRTYSGIYWLFSDWMGTSDDTVLTAISSNGGTVKKFKVQGATNWNWEDIAIDESNNLWICDIGDNERERSSYVLYKLSEPNPYGSSTNAYVSKAYRFTLPDGSKDMDSCFVWQGVPYLVHKGAGAALYRVPLDSSMTVTAQRLAYWGKDGNIGGADISTDGRRLALISDTSDNHWIIERSSSSTSVKDFFTSPSREWKIHFYNSAGGGIAFVNGKYDFVVSSETGGFWLVKQSMYDSGGSTPSDPPTSGKSYRLTFDGYDYDNKYESTISVNGKVVANLPASYVSSNNNNWASFSVDMSSAVASGSNSLTFKQNIYSSCIRNVRIVETTSGNTIFSSSTQKCLTQGGSLPSTTYTFNIS